MELLRRDVMFLTKCHIMDYSLLLGIHQHGNAVPDASASSRFGDFPTTESTLPTGSSKVTSDEPLQDPDKKLRGPHSRRDTGASNCGFDKEFHIPWYRQDSGGLNSVSTVFPQDLELSLQSHRGSMVKVDNPPVTYFFGVVDILQQYTLRKKVEHLWKTRVLRQDRYGLSAVNEADYGKRFLNFLDKIIE